MRLTRRDAILALSAAGVAVSTLGVSQWNESRSASIGAHEISTLTAVAETIYPSEIDGIPEFVERYVRGRTASGESEGIVDAIGYLDAYASAWHDEQFRALDERSRSETLRTMGVDTASPDPGGSDVERVRYYVVNELLFALYTSPTGGELVGIENPIGHAGGIESYQRGTHE